MNIKHELETPISTLKTVISLLRQEKLINDRLIANSTKAFERIEGILSSMNDESCSIYGMWELIELYSINEETGQKTYPFGEKVTGHISYNQDGTMSVIIENESNNVTAYTAKFIISQNKIEHKILQSTNKSWLGTSLFRKFSIEDEKLKISTFKENSTDGNTSTHLSWKKVSN